MCGDHIFTEHPGLGLTDVYAAVISVLPFIPGLHVNYGEANAAHSGRSNEAEGFSQGVWWLRNSAGGIVAKGLSPRTQSTLFPLPWTGTGPFPCHWALFEFESVPF